MHIIGASGHAKVVADILFTNNIEISGIWDENPDIDVFLNHKISGNFDAFKQIETDQVIIAIGNNEIRKRLAKEILNNKAIAIHPKSTVASSASIGVGTVIMANAVVNPFVMIGNYVIINTSAVVDHDCVLDNYVHISPQAALSGDVTVGEGTHIGTGACVIQGIKIGKWAVIGAGAVIVRDIPDYTVVVGNPGKIIRYTELKEYE